MNDELFKLSEDGTVLIEFIGGDDVTEAIIPESVTEIRRKAFYWCRSLTSIKIPESVIKIGYRAFYHCRSLTSINVDANNPYFASIDGILFNKKKTILGIYPQGNQQPSYEIPKGVTEIGMEAFAGCSSLKSINIPEGVTGIGDGAFYGCKSLTSISILDNVTEIGKDAFASCSSLKSITLPENVKEIGEGAFAGCSSLKSIDIPDSVKKIGERAFNDCYSLTSINVDANNLYFASIDGVLFNKKKTILIKYPKGKQQTLYNIPDSVTEIGQLAFYGCESLTSISILDNVTEIRRRAFDGCSSLKSIDIPDSVTKIGEGAFDGCSSLKSIDFPEGVMKIGKEGEGDFNGCNSLTSISIPKSVTKIVDGTFDHCTSLTSIEVDGYNSYFASIDGVLFNKEKTILIKYPKGKQQTSYNIPEGVTKIGERAFAYCASLTSINIPESVTEIGRRAFDGCSNLYKEDNGIKYIDCIAVEVTDKNRASYQLKEGTRFISERAFEDCKSLIEINIPEGVTEFGQRSFWGCSSLTSIKIPESVKKIGGSAFYGCHSLTSIYIPNSIESIENNVFEDCTNIEYLNYNCDLINPQDCGWKLKTVDIGNSVTKIEEGAFCHCRSLTSINVDANNPYFASIDGVLFNKEKTILIKYPEGKEQNSYTIPVSVTEIGEGAFEGCSNLLEEDNGIIYIDCIAVEVTDKNRASYKLKEGTRFISEHAFACCESLIEINIPEGVTEIGRYAFINCEKLESITIPDSVTKIGESAFDGCKILTSINIPEDVTEIGNWAFSDCSSLTSINIPEGVKEIGKRVFYGCSSLTSVTIPKSVTEIGEGAFEYCESLTSINIPENVTKIGGGAFVGCSNLTIICSENIAPAINTSEVKEVKVRKKVCCSELFSYFYFNNDKLTTKKEKALAMAQECCYGDFDLDYPEVYVTTEEKKLIVNIECNKEEIRKRRNEIDKEYPNASEEEKEELKKENEKLIELSEKLGNRDSGTIEDEIIISGEYIRHYPGEKAKIFLYDINNQSPEQLVATYVHEMMHASYDYNHHVYNKYTSCVEEPLTEYGALRLLEDMDAQQGTSYFDAAYRSVKAKQYSPGVCHYGFGAYLYDQHKKSQSPVNWERMMAAAKYGLCSENILQTEYGKRFSSGCYPHHDEATMAHELMRILRDGVQMAQKGRNAFICYCTYILGMQDYKTIGICSTLDCLLKKFWRYPLLRICDLYNQRDIKYVKAIRSKKNLNNNFKKSLDLYIQFLEDTRPEVIALRKGTKF